MSVSVTIQNVWSSLVRRPHEVEEAITIARKMHSYEHETLGVITLKLIEFRKNGSEVLRIDYLDREQFIAVLQSFEEDRRIEDARRTARIERFQALKNTSITIAESDIFFYTSLSDRNNTIDILDYNGERLFSIHKLNIGHFVGVLKSV